MNSNQIRSTASCCYVVLVTHDRCLSVCARHRDCPRMCWSPVHSLRMRYITGAARWVCAQGYAKHGEPPSHPSEMRPVKVVPACDAGGKLDHTRKGMSLPVAPQHFGVKTLRENDHYETVRLCSWSYFQCYGKLLDILSTISYFIWFIYSVN